MNCFAYPRREFKGRDRCLLSIRCWSVLCARSRGSDELYKLRLLEPFLDRPWGFRFEDLVEETGLDRPTVSKHARYFCRKRVLMIYLPEGRRRQLYSVANVNHFLDEIASLTCGLFRRRYGELTPPMIELAFERKLIEAKPWRQISEGKFDSYHRLWKAMRRQIQRIDKGERVRWANLPKPIVEYEARLWSRVPEERAFEDVWGFHPPSVELALHGAMMVSQRTKQKFNDVFRRLTEGRKLPRQRSIEEIYERASRRTGHIVERYGANITSEIKAIRQRYEPLSQSATKAFLRKERQRQLNYLWIATDEA